MYCGVSFSSDAFTRRSADDAFSKNRIRDTSGLPSAPAFRLACRSGTLRPRPRRDAAPCPGADDAAPVAPPPPFASSAEAAAGASVAPCTDGTTMPLEGDGAPGPFLARRSTRLPMSLSSLSSAVAAAAAAAAAAPAPFDLPLGAGAAGLSGAVVAAFRAGVDDDDAIVAAAAAVARLVAT